MKNRKLIEKIRESVIGEKHPIATPFGHKPLVYADYTASGRSLTFIENKIQSLVLPYYANTHTESSFTGAQSTALREEARQQIKQAVGGTERDKVIFCGSGATAAINKLIDILNIRIPKDIDEQFGFSSTIKEEDRPVVFIGPYEHHSNELPWRECIATLVVISLDELGQLDIAELEQKLQEFKDRKLLIGSFSAASNVTGIKTDVELVTQVLHKYNAYSCWDYAASAPYVNIDMNGVCEDTYKDAVFISPHKFIGGPGTPGLLILKEKLMKNKVPSVQGGGTVVYVTPETHRYVEDHERREEGGTPAIVESIRAGLVFKLQQEVGTREIGVREDRFIKMANQRLGRHKNINVLGNIDAPQLSITSFIINHGTKAMHYGFVVALLNDLFGIQARGGCSCAGPYGHKLLGMNTEYSQEIEAELYKGAMILRPGWVRVNFNYFIDDQTFNYINSAIEMIAEHGWRLLPYYDFDTNDGVWRYQGIKLNTLTKLSDFNFSSTEEEKIITPTCSLDNKLADALYEFYVDRSSLKRYKIVLSPEAELLRWFVLPQEIKLPKKQ